MKEILFALIGQVALMSVPPLILLFFLRHRLTDKMAFSVLGFQALVLVIRYGVPPIVSHLQWGSSLSEALLAPLVWYEGDGVMAFWPGMLAAGVTVLVLMLVVSRKKTPTD